MHQQVLQSAPSESSELSVSNAPLETTEARSDRDKKLAELMLRQVDRALLIPSQSSGPPERRPRPGKVDKTTKVQCMCDPGHNITRARATQTSSQAPPLLLEKDPDERHRPRQACSQPEGKKAQR